jgi:hypothetical protein
MKYYCKNCESVIILGNRNHVKDTVFACCVCKDGKLEPYPDYETPEQYKERTGKPYPDSGLVWIYFNPLYEWCDMTYRKAGLNKNGVHGEMYTMIVIADPPVPPPNNWRPQ